MDRLNTIFRKGRIGEKEYDTEYEKLKKIIAKYQTSQDPHTT